MLVSFVVSVLGAIAGLGLPGVALARAIGARIICAVGLADGCALGGGALLERLRRRARGAVRDHAPRILYEPGMRALPVDFRRCREDACADGAESGDVRRTKAGEPVACSSTWSTAVRALPFRTESTARAGAPATSTSSTWPTTRAARPARARPRSRASSATRRRRSARRPITPTIGSPFRSGSRPGERRARQRPPRLRRRLVSGRRRLLRRRRQPRRHGAAARRRPRDAARRINLIALEPIAASHPNVSFAITATVDQEGLVRPRVRGNRLTPAGAPRRRRSGCGRSRSSPSRIRTACGPEVSNIDAGAEREDDPLILARDRAGRAAGLELELELVAEPLAVGVLDLEPQRVRARWSHPRGRRSRTRSRTSAGSAAPRTATCSSRRRSRRALPLIASL